MSKSLIINKYISKEFLKIFLYMLLGFSCLSIIMNLFEEINFFGDFGVGILVPFFMSILIMPNIIYTLLPFIVLFTSIWLFLKLIRTEEIVAMKASGMSNISLILIPSVVAFVLGIFIVLAVNPIISTLVEKYETIKANYHTDQEYLAAITANGIWMKQNKSGIISIIRSSNLKNENLENVSIYQFKEDNTLINRMEAESAYIKNTTWILKNVKEYKKVDDENTLTNFEEVKFDSIYNLEKIRTLYTNLDTISFWKIPDQIELLKERGYSTKEMQGKFQKTISFPFFLVSMVLLAGVFTLGTKYKGSNWNYVLISIIACIVIYYTDYFSLALGKTERLPIEVSVWMPVIIVFIFSTVGLIHVNQK